MAKTPASTVLGQDLKKRGWTFVGPTTPTLSCKPWVS